MQHCAPLLRAIPRGGAAPRERSGNRQAATGKRSGVRAAGFLLAAHAAAVDCLACGGGLTGFAPGIDRLISSGGNRQEQQPRGLQARLRRDLESAQWLAAKVGATPGWRVLAPVPLQTVCVRHEPEGLAGEDLDRHTLAWVERVNRSGAAYLTPAVLDDRWMCRVSIGAIATERAHVEELWSTMRGAV
mgnify:CR=1 FL=1